MSQMKSWSIEGAEKQPIFGNTHLPETAPIGAVFIAHGFKGYKDYGMFPRIASALCDAGLIAHRFNFSHSGMTENIATFEHPDLFENDTWNKQVFDFRAVIDAAHSGVLEGGDSKYVMFGHSRGGISALLAAGRFADDQSFPQPAGVTTAAAPSRCHGFTQAQSEVLLSGGYVESPSSRTGQILRVGKGFLQEQLDDPAGHDLMSMVAKIQCPLLVIHGEDDPTVEASNALDIANAALHETRVVLIPKANHVFNTPNPLPPDESPSSQLRQLISAVEEFAKHQCS